LRIDHDPGGRRGSKVATMCVIYSPLQRRFLQSVSSALVHETVRKIGQFCVSGVAELDGLSANLDTGDIEGR
jgi:hypothetical protein